MTDLIETIRRFIADWGYWGVGLGLLLENAGIPVPGETILILASVVSYSTHELNLAWIIVVGTIAATVGDNIGYWIGRKGGRPLLERWKSFFRISNKFIEQAEDLIEKRGALAIFFARFVTGARVVAGPLAGVLHMDWRRFALFNFLGAVVWVTVVACVSHLFGSQLDRLLEFMKEANYAILILVGILVVGFLLRRRRVYRD